MKDAIAVFVIFGLAVLISGTGFVIAEALTR